MQNDETMNEKSNSRTNEEYQKVISKSTANGVVNNRQRIWNAIKAILSILLKDIQMGFTK